MPKLTVSELKATEVAASLRAGAPIIWINTKEETRVTEAIAEAAYSSGFKQVKLWDVKTGVAQIGLTDIDATLRAPDDCFDAIKNSADSKNPRTVWVLRSLAPWINAQQPVNVRGLLNLIQYLPTVDREYAQQVVVVDSSGDIPVDLQAHCTFVDWPLPDRAEVAAILDQALQVLPESKRAAASPNGNKEQAIDAALGLTGDEIALCYKKSLVRAQRIDPEIVAEQKKQLIERERLLTLHKPLDGGLDSVGGLDVLKSWLRKRKLAYTPAARAYGLPLPKGVLLVGPPGNGKTLSAKAISAAFLALLIQFDLGALRSKYVGDSEQNIRRVFKTLTAIGPCVVWADEIEKALGGATQGAADGGVSSDALGTLLQFMNDNDSGAFFVATANNPEQLPAELMRKGRFDEIFFIDMPNRIERVEILKATLIREYQKTTKRNAEIVRLRPIDQIDCEQVAARCRDFTGSEIASLVPEAMFTAFQDNGRAISTRDLIEAAEQVVPLSKTQAAKIKAMKDWAQGKARLASTPVSEETTPRVSGIDL